MPRQPQPDDLYRFQIPTRPRLSPDGASVAFVVQAVSPGFDAYRQSLWLVPADGSAPARRLTMGPRRDFGHAFSPDGRTLAFLADRRAVLEEEPGKPAEKDRDDLVQVYLLPMDGGEARRLTDLPGGVSDLAWSPDGRRLAVVSNSLATSMEEDRRLRGLAQKPPSKPGTPPASDLRYTDRLRYQLNGAGFVQERVERLWVVDVETGDARRLTHAAWAREAEPAWSPDGTRIAFRLEAGPDWDVADRAAIAVVDVASGAVTPLTAGPDAAFRTPAWLPDGERVVALGGRVPEHTYRPAIWLLAADGSGAAARAEVDLSGRHDVEPGAGMNSDVTIGEPPRLLVSADGQHVAFLAPAKGAMELFRLAIADGALERLTEGRHLLSGADRVALAGGGTRVATIVSSPTGAPEAHVLDLPPGPLRAPADPVRITRLNDGLLADLVLGEPEERWWTVDGLPIQGWFLPARGEAPRPASGAAAGMAPASAAAASTARPLVLEIHGGPHTLYGWAPGFEFQVLAGQGIGVLYCNPRGSEGYGRAFVEGCLGDWGDGPMRDVLAGVDALIAEGKADPARLGLTGGSYGGYLTNWIIGHDRRFRAAMTCRSVSDMTILHITGDLSSGDWPLHEHGTVPWDDWAYFRKISPITYAEAIRTPLLIQHAENDIRCTIAQAEALFTVLRALDRPVRLMRVPGETHELTRSGTPFRRVEHLVQVRDWFTHFLVKGRRSLPELPPVRATR